MPYQTSWYQEKRVIYIRVWGDVTIDEIHEMSEEQGQYLNQGKPLVHSISDITHVQSFPNNLAQLRDSMQASRHPNVGWILIVGPTTPLKRFFTSMLTQILIPKARFRMFDKMEEAVNFLKDVDSTFVPDPEFGVQTG
jgi:hypothetical protein